MTQHTENELKPCPWCDSKPDIIEDDGKTMSGHYTAYVKCSLCENVIPHVGWGKTMKGAISETVSHWNTRHESEGLKELRQENERLRGVLLGAEEKFDYDNPIDYSELATFYIKCHQLIAPTNNKTGDNQC